MKHPQSSFLKPYVRISLIVTILASCNKQEIKSNTVTTVTTDATDEIASDLIIQKSLVAWYPFNGNTLDSSGNGNNVIFNNATLTTDRFGNANSAYSFNGINNYMEVENDSTLNPEKEITLFAIVKVNGFYQGECHGNRIINKNFSDYDYGSYLLNFDDGYYYAYNHCKQPVKSTRENFTVSYGNGEFYSIGGIDTINNIKLGKWYAIAFTFDGDTAKFYVNNRLSSTSTGRHINFTPNDENLFFGTSSTKNILYPYWFNGVIDEIRIYSKALTEKQVQKLSK